MKILAIDTSCDDTSAAIVDGTRVLSNVISSQVRYHTKFGGVVPFLAQRLHQERIGAVVEMALSRAGLGWDAVEAIAVTEGPGLAPALQVGIAHAKELAAAHGLPLYAVNHMAGHVASCLAQAGARQPRVEFPALALLVSGKHSEFVFMPRFGQFEIVGQTVDDAIGEAYDKVARMLGLGYPGGKVITKLAAEGDAAAYPLPVPMLRSGDCNLSYSGLKNAVRLLMEEIGTPGAQQIRDVAASFERVAQESIMLKLKKALEARPDVHTVLVGGGVAANAPLRAKVRRLARERGLQAVFPANLKLCTDNAAMIGVAASLGVQAGQRPVNPEALDRRPSLSIEAASLESAGHSG